MEKRTAHYLAFFKYPQALRAHLRATDLPEGLNNQIEHFRRNAGGHLHSQREALIKVTLLADQLFADPWSRICPAAKSNLPALTHLFHQRFQAEIHDEQLLKQSLRQAPSKLGPPRPAGPRSYLRSTSVPPPFFLRGSSVLRTEVGRR